MSIALKLSESETDNTSLMIDLLEPLSGVSPGQVAAVYFQKWCLGSGIIRETRCQDQTVDQARETGPKLLGRVRQPPPRKSIKGISAPPRGILKVNEARKLRP